MKHTMFRDSISMFRMLHLHHPILCLSKPDLFKAPSVSLFGTHGRCVTHLMLDLSIKKCVPCDLKDLRPMTEEVANGLLRQVAGWNLVNEGGVLKLNRSMKVKSFTKGLELFQLIAGVAEAEGHHPDLHLVEWNNITIEIWTHAVDGLTENDFILATKINKLNMHHLLRRKLTD
ncbi:pterin-4-alpha-carbinolamine dehydratase 2, mitochondrial-like isoform X2 [Quercus lobata]|nr:pterin-4-alpha-carbinolamine dehydratase 2, mitochondrial-like isoform X2 [Quercus lobata]